MHTRKTYIVYPPKFTPLTNDCFYTTTSRLRAWKLARKLGAGTSVSVETAKYASSRTKWVATTFQHLWKIEENL